MRRVALIAVLLCAGVVAVTATGASDPKGPGGYRVRAIFDDAPVNTGANVIIAGVAVGKVVKLDVTPEHKAALTLAITDRRFTPFRADARCGTRLQSLIGERVVTCIPGTAAAPPLLTIDHGAGQGQHLLSLDRTYGAVDLDLVNAIYRRPAPEQLSIILAELGAGFATRGPELAHIIRRANPALDETDRLIRVLADQRRQLQALASDGARVAGPLARKRRQLTGFLRSSQHAAAVSVEHRGAYAAGLRKLPGALRSLVPLMQQLNTFALRTTPVLRSIAAGAPALGEATQEIAPFSRRSVPALRSLARSTEVQAQQLRRAIPLAHHLQGLGHDLVEPATDLGRLLTSLRAGGAIPNLLSFVYGAANAGNGYDATSHYLRVEGLSGACGQYTSHSFFGCDAQFGQAKEGGGSTRATPALARRAARDATAGGDAAKNSANGLLSYLLGAGR